MRTGMILAGILTVAFFGCGKTAAPKKKPTTAKKVKDLIYRLGNKEKAKRKKAEDGLVKIGKPAVKPLIDALLGKKTETVGVGLLGTSPAAGATLLTGDESVKAYAARALGRIGEKEAVEPLIGALKDENAKSAAAEALKKITKQDFGDDAAQWAAWHAKGGK
ncbi:MAG: HEAT repeat domain-containing protein [Planctomycetota bacterium]|jgi:HEAT repeat protein